MSFSNTYDTTNSGSAVGNREDLRDITAVLEPELTPAYSMMDKSKATATFVEWTVDSLEAPVTTGVREGEDVSSFDDKFANKARLGNYVQKFRRNWKVSDLQQAVNSVGPVDRAQAEMKCIREIKRDIEATFMSANDRAAENGVDTGYQLRGLGDWLDSAGPSDVPAAYRTPADSIHASGAFTETVLNDLITSIYRQSGTVQNLTLIADTALRRTISDFQRAEGTTTATPYSVNQDSESKKITLSVSMYDSDQGMVSIVNGNPVCMPDTTNKDTGYLINPAYVSVAELIPMGTTALENQGGGERGYVDTTLTLCMKHPQAHGKITAIA